MPQLSLLSKARIISNAENGWSIRRIAELYNINRNTVHKILKKWRNEQTLNRQHGSGRPRNTTPLQDDALVMHLRENPFDSVVDAVAASNYPGSLRTAQSRVRKSELRCRYAARKLILKQEHKEARLSFALEFIVYDIDFWRNVIFTDEKIFQSMNCGRIRVYRPANTRFEEKYISNNDKSGRFSVNMWAWISIHGPGVLWHIEGRFNANSYIQILENVMLPSVAHFFPQQDYIYQQDNCPIHKANNVTNWFTENNINVLDWPSRSPDLNLIENVWGFLVKVIEKRNVRPRNSEELLNVLNDAWETISEEYCINLYNSLPRRFNELLRKNGAIIKY